MFNSGNLKRAQEYYETAEAEYKEEYEKLVNSSQRLYSSKNQLVTSIEEKMIDKSELQSIDNVLLFKNLQLELDAFKQVKKRTQEQIDKNMDAKGGNATGGMAAGAAAAVAGVAAPSAIMALTTTFGVASTGTAISTLSGAALTNATLAAVGGGSMAAGSALLGALGPIGLGVGLLITSVTGFRANKKNKEGIEKFNAARHEYEEATKANTHAITSIAELSGKISSALGTVKATDDDVRPVSDRLGDLVRCAELLNTPVVRD